MFDKPAFRVSPTLHFSEPREPQTTTMTHIASCIRPDAAKTSVYITQETSYRMTVRAHKHTTSFNFDEPPPASPVLFAKRPSGYKRLEPAKCIFGQESFYHQLVSGCPQISTLAVSEEPCGITFRQASCSICWPFWYITQRYCCSYRDCSVLATLRLDVEKKKSQCPGAHGHYDHCAGDAGRFS